MSETGRGLSGKWVAVLGAVAGLLVWLRDCDFFLNAGGPSHHVSNAILKFLNLQGSAYPLPVLVPALVLIGAGIVIAAGLAWLLRPRTGTRRG